MLLQILPTNTGLIAILNNSRMCSRIRLIKFEIKDSDPALDFVIWAKQGNKFALQKQQLKQWKTKKNIWTPQSIGSTRNNVWSVITMTFAQMLSTLPNQNQSSVPPSSSSFDFSWQINPAYGVCLVLEEDGPVRKSKRLLDLSVGDDGPPL